MKTSFIKNNFRFSLLAMLLLLLFNSCNKKEKLTDFDTSKLKEVYTFDLEYTAEKFKERKKTDALDNFTMVTTLAMIGKINFEANEKTLFTSTNRFNPSIKSYHSFDFKIENDSIIYIKDENSETEFVKSAILLEYGADYDYFIIKPLIGIHKNFEFKAVEIE